MGKSKTYFFTVLHFVCVKVYGLLLFLYTNREGSAKGGGGCGKEKDERDRERERERLFKLIPIQFFFYTFFLKLIHTKTM
jgi:hypothetical protein